MSIDHNGHHPAPSEDASDVAGDIPGDDAALALDLDRTAIQSIDRAANILALLDQDTRSLTAAMVADRLGLNRTTARRYLNSLQGAGFLSASFGPGPLLDQLSALVSVRQQVLTFAPAIMRQLSDATGLTTVLSFLGRSGAVVTLVEEASQGTIILTVRVGTVLEAKAAQSRVLLAFQSDLAAVTRAHGALTAAEAAQERDVLAGVRRHRIAWADLFEREGLASVAVPIFATNEVQAAMAVLGTTAMIGRDRSTERVLALEHAAETLSSMLAG